MEDVFGSLRARLGASTAVVVRCIAQSMGAMRLLAAVLLVGVVLSNTASATIAYVQGNKDPHTPMSSVTLTFTSAQSAGNLNVVALGWNDLTSHVISVTDTMGNAYSVAIGPNTATGVVTTVVYYAQNIAAAPANGNTITVTFDGLVTPDIRAAEYSGISTTNALDGAVTNSGVGTALNSGSLTTTNANDLLVGVSGVAGWVQGAGSGYTQRIMSSWGNILQDKIVSATGTYSTTTTQDINDWWTMQLVAFKGASGGTIGYVQGTSFTGTADQIVTATYTSAQGAGDLNVVAVGWYLNWLPNPTVTDTQGNTYTLADARRMPSNDATSLIYYAKNIAAAAANSNKVIIKFSGWVPYPDVRIAEYSGIDTTNPLDVVSSNSGSGTALSSGSATTTTANSLLVGASTIAGYTVSAGSGYTQRVLTDYSNILEDRIVTSTGSYSATSTQDINSYWVMQMVAFKGASGDTTAPSTPTGLSVNAVSSTQIDLSWTASTDNVAVTGYRIERCSGTSCSSFAQIATSTTTTYSDTGLSASTNYTYRVRAVDAVSNFSGYSSTAGATTPAPPDTTAPSAPESLVATVVSSTQINLSWVAATDNVAVTGYQLERCQGASCTTFTQIGTPTATTYSDTGLTASTEYRYRVRATDAVSNLSAYSNIFNATTQSGPDTQAPTVPSNLTVSAVSTSQLSIAWSASTDNVGVTAYLLERCQGAGCSSFTQIANQSGTTYMDSGLSTAITYRYRVRAKDAANNLSNYSDIASAATQYAGPITFTYTYDNLGRISHAAGSDGSSIDYTYDANGNVTSISR